MVFSRETEILLPRTLLLLLLSSSSLLSPASSLGRPKLSRAWRHSRGFPPALLMGEATPFKHALAPPDPAATHQLPVSTRKQQGVVSLATPSCRFRLAHFAVRNLSGQGLGGDTACRGQGPRSQEAAPCPPAWPALCSGPCDLQGGLCSPGPVLLQ